MEDNYKISIDYQYDKNNRLVKCHVQGEHANQYTYDPAGNLLICGDASLQGLHRPDAASSQCVSKASRSHIQSEWRCTCGSVNKGAFCPKCGTRRSSAPSAPPDGSWLCTTCGRTNKGAFCPKCGAKRP